MYVVIVGGGMVGMYLAQTMLKSGNEVAIIEQDTETADNLSVELEGDYLVIQGDGCDSRFQEDAGVRRADVLVAVTGQDDVNLVACEIAMRIFQTNRVIARVNNPKNQRIFRALGIEAISSTPLIANLIEEEALLGGVSVATSLAHGNVALSEVNVRLKRYPEGVLAQEVALPEGSLIVAVSSSREEVEVVGDETMLMPGDKAIVAADTEVMPEVRAILRSM